MSDLYTFEPLDNERAPRMSDPNADETGGGCAECGSSRARLLWFLLYVGICCLYGCALAEAVTGGVQ